jgi:hypothetical protein
MILTDIRKVIDRKFETENIMDAMRYSQGYIDFPYGLEQEKVTSKS